MGRRFTISPTWNLCGAIAHSQSGRSRSRTVIWRVAGESSRAAGSKGHTVAFHSITWSAWTSNIGGTSMPSGIKPLRICTLVEGKDLDPVRTLAGGIASDQFERAILGVDRIRRERVRLLAGDDHEAAAAGGIDGEPAGLLLGRRASEVTQLSARAIHPECAQRARRPLGGVEKTAVRREVKISGPDVIVGVAWGLVRARGADRASRHARDEFGIRGQHGDGVELLENPSVRVERQRGHRAGELVQYIDEAVVGRDNEVTRPCTLLELQDRGRIRR